MMDQWQDIAKRLRTEAPDRVLMLKGAIVIEALAEEFLAYEAAKPVPASGGVEALSISINHVLHEALSTGGGSLAWHMARGLSQKLAETALASPIPAEAKAAFRIAKRGGLIEHEPLLPAFDLPDGVYDLYATPPAMVEAGRFKLGDRVTKTKGSSWQGHVVGFYRTSLTPEGYCVESEREPGSVQIYPAAALTLAKDG